MRMTVTSIPKERANPAQTPATIAPSLGRVSAGVCLTLEAPRPVVAPQLKQKLSCSLNSLPHLVQNMERALCLSYAPPRGFVPGEILPKIIDFRAPVADGRFPARP